MPRFDPKPPAPTVVFGPGDRTNRTDLVEPQSVPGVGRLLRRRRSVIGGIAFIVVAAFAMMRSSGACEEAVARAESSPAVVQALGAFLEVDGSSPVPSSGPERRNHDSGNRTPGKARINVVASKTNGTWCSRP